MQKMTIFDAEKKQAIAAGYLYTFRFFLFIHLIV